VGYTGALRLASSTNGFAIAHVATDMLIEAGAVL
jgi:hypothetical protein